MRTLARVTDVEPLGGRSLRVTFSDGLVRELDFASRLPGVLASIDDEASFAKVTVDSVAGTACWPNGIDLDPDVLHGDHASTSAVQPRLLREYLPAGLQAAVGCSASAHVAAISAPNIACPYARRRPLQTGGGLDSADSVQYSSATRSGDFNNRLPSPNCQSRTTHDALPRFVTVSDPLTALTSTYDYAGRTDTVVTGGATRKYTYDRMGRNLTDTNQSTVGATAVLSTTNEWDNADRLTKRTTGPVGVAGAGAGVETFGYDQASRLTSWTNQANVTTPYTWSAASNRTAAGANTFT